MANSLRAKLSKLRHDGNITDAKYQKLIAKLDGHDKEIRNNTIDEFAEKLKRKIMSEIDDCADWLECVDEIAEEMKEEQ